MGEMVAETPRDNSPFKVQGFEELEGNLCGWKWYELWEHFPGILAGEWNKNEETFPYYEGGERIRI